MTNVTPLTEIEYLRQAIYCVTNGEKATIDTGTGIIFQYETESVICQYNATTHDMTISSAYTGALLLACGYLPTGEFYSFGFHSDCLTHEKHTGGTL